MWNKHVNQDQEKQLNAKIEIKIQDKIEKVQESGSMSNDTGDIEVLEVEDVGKQNDITINKNSVIRFVTLQAFPNLWNIAAIIKNLFTSTNFLRHLNVFKKSINNDFFTSELFTGIKFLKT